MSTAFPDWRAISRPILSAVLSLSLPACGGEEADGAAGSESPEKPCEGERPEGAACLTNVTGRVVDEVDQPVSDLAVTVCGPVCFRAVTDQDGNFDVELNRFLLVSEYSVQAHGSPTASTFYHRMPDDLSDGKYNAGTLRVLELATDGDIFTTKLDLNGEQSPLQVVASDGVAIEVGEGTVVRLSVSDALEGDEGRRFRVRELDEGQIDEFVPELGGARVFALGPFEAEFIPDDDSALSVSLSVDNRLGWNAGDEVEVLALGTYLDPDWLTPSLFETIGTATVSNDGMLVELPAGSSGPGLRHLTWFAMVP